MVHRVGAIYLGSVSFWPSLYVVLAALIETCLLQCSAWCLSTSISSCPSFYHRLHGELLTQLSSTFAFISTAATVRLYSIQRLLLLSVHSRGTEILTSSMPAVPNCCCSKVSAPYWLNIYTGLTHHF